MGRGWWGEARTTGSGMLKSTETPDKFADLSLEEWSAAYAPHVVEIPTTRFVIAADGDLVRLAFGHSGPPISSDGKAGTPVFNVAMSMSPMAAFQLLNLLQRVLLVGHAQPEQSTGPST